MTYRQLHAGQLRYHDFSKLRELHLARQGLWSSRTLQGPVTWTSMTEQLQHQQQIRPFHLKTLFSKVLPSSWQSGEAAQLRQLEMAANATPNLPSSQYELVSKWVMGGRPEWAVERYHRTKAYALDSRLALWYLSAMQTTQQFSYFRLEDLVKRLKSVEPHTAQLLKEEFDSQVGAMHAPKRDQVQRAIQVLLKNVNTSALTMSPFAAAGGGVAATAAATAGLVAMDPSKPINVKVLSDSSSMGSVKYLLVRLATAFVIVSALATLIDEKGVGKALGATGSTKHLQEAENSTVRFSDVKGCKEAQAELEEIVEFLKDPTRFSRLGGKLPRGLLLVGPPGTGKTLLAKAVAGEAGVPFFFSSGSQFEEVYVGLGAKRVRELFEAAKKKSPAIIFIDEIDALGGTRKLKDQSALKMTLNELLVQLDGFEDNTGIIVIGATNFADSLDPALLRPGRFDKHVTVPLPDIAGRKEILEMYAQKTTLAEDVDLDVLARGTTGMSGADLSNLMNQAAIKASVDGLDAITMAVLEFAKDKILMGAERKSALISDETKRCTAYHEAGHALVATLTDGAYPIHKATIMPRGNALGMVTQLPEGDQTSQSYKEMLARMDVCMGGRVAEELIFGEENVTSGATSDIYQATRLARAMVTRCGFSDKVGIVFHDYDDPQAAIASAETRAVIDAEVKRLADESYRRAKDLLRKYAVEHTLLAECLLEYETLTGEEVREIVLHRRKPVRPPPPPKSTPNKGTTTNNNNNSKVPSKSILVDKKSAPLKQAAA